MKTNQFGEPLTNCPVCKVEVQKRSLKNHIYNMAKSEAWKRLFDLKYSGKKIGHITYFKKNTIKLGDKHYWNKNLTKR